MDRKERKEMRRLLVNQKKKRKKWPYSYCCETVPSRNLIVCSHSDSQRALLGGPTGPKGEKGDAETAG